MIVLGSGVVVSAGPPQPARAPEGVRKTAATVLAGWKHDFHREEEDGSVVWEASTRTKLEVVLSERGQVLETEVALPPGTLPPAVMAAVKARAGASPIVEAEVSVTSAGVRFKVETRSGTGPETEYLCDPTG